MSRYRLSAQAGRDLRKISKYSSGDNPQAADRLLKEIDAKCQALAQTSETGRSREELAPGLRSSHVGRYLIFFRPDPEGIEVVRVVHGSRDIPILFE